MAGAIKTITFADRQTGIPACVVVNLKFIEGDVRAEYISGSELEVGTDWKYQFLVQEEDLPGPMVLADVQTSGIIAPLWSCPEEDDETECQSRAVSCFEGLPIIDELTENDYVAILRFMPDCEIYCIKLMAPEALKAALALL